VTVRAEVIGGAIAMMLLKFNIGNEPMAKLLVYPVFKGAAGWFANRPRGAVVLDGFVWRIFSAACLVEALFCPNSPIPAVIRLSGAAGIPTAN
jgi:hypothetical protein